MVDEGAETHRVGRTAGDRDFGHVEIEQLALRRIDVVTDGDGFLVVVRVADHDRQVEDAEPAGRIGHERDLEVADRAFVLIVEVTVFEGFAPGGDGVELLGRGVAQDQFQRVLTLPDVGRKAELGGCRRVFDLGHELIVDPQRVGRAGVFEVQVDVAVGPDVGNVHGLAHDRYGVARCRHLGFEGHPVASGFAVAGLGVVARVVGDDFRAVDAAPSGRHRDRIPLLHDLGCRGERAGCQRSRQYRSFHRLRGCIIRTKIQINEGKSKRVCNLPSGSI